MKHKSIKLKLGIAFFIIILIWISINLFSQTVFFVEEFEDINFADRGWYDNTNLILSTQQHIAGSKSSVEYHFLKGSNIATSGLASRIRFQDSESIYLSYYIKYSANWEGSNLLDHPHEFYFLTNMDGKWTAPGNTHTTFYVEQNEGVPRLLLQDALNIDANNIGMNLVGKTELRSVAGCNGDGDGYGNGDCYKTGTTHLNSKRWDAGKIYFSDSTGNYYKNDWHFIEVFVRLNSIYDGIGIADGIFQYWYDGETVIDLDNVLIRTGKNPTMRFNQFMIGPYIGGSGSPVDQTFWIDDLKIASEKPIQDSNTPVNIKK